MDTDQQAPILGQKENIWWKTPSFTLEDLIRLIVLVALGLTHYFAIKSELINVKTQVAIVQGSVSKLEVKQDGYVTQAQLLEFQRLDGEVHRRLEDRNEEVLRFLTRVEQRMETVDRAQRRR